MVEFFYTKNFNDSNEIETEYQISDIQRQSRAKTCFSETTTPVKNSEHKAIQTEFSP